MLLMLITILLLLHISALIQWRDEGLYLRRVPRLLKGCAVGVLETRGVSHIMVNNLLSAHRVN